MNWMHAGNEIKVASRRAWHGLPTSASWTSSRSKRVPRKIQMLRRRWLQLRGSRLRTSMASSTTEYSLAMLDERGIVVAWHDGVSADSAPDEIVDAHVRQFYVLADVAADVPQRCLRMAAAMGVCIEQGWRRRTSGAVYWGTTTIRSLRNRNGQLQGFSHLTRPAAGPKNVLQSSAGHGLDSSAADASRHAGMHARPGS